MTVKPIDREKIEEMLLIEQSCFEDEAWTKAMLCEGLECPGAIYLGAFEGDRLVGYLALLVSLDFADIATVGVVPEFQRRGIGKALVETAVFMRQGQRWAKFSRSQRRKFACRFAVCKMRFQTRGRAEKLLRHAQIFQSRRFDYGKNALSGID